MLVLTNNDLKNINGGGISFAVGALIVAGVIFIIGVIDGYVNPKSCNIK